MQSMRLKCMFAPLLMTWDSTADPSPQTQSDDRQPLKAPSESCRPHKKRNMFLLRLVPGVGYRAQGCETSASNWRRVPATWLPMQTYTTAHTQMKMKGRGRENRNIKKQILKVQWAIFSVQHPQEEGVHDGVTLSTACLPGVLGCAAWCGVVCFVVVDDFMSPRCAASAAAALPSSAFLWLALCLPALWF